MFINNPEIIEKMKQESGKDIFDLVECRIKSEKSYNIYLFIVILKDQKELKKVWEDISSEVATSFQTELKINIEIWNIYILFLVQSNVDTELRYLIEQDKYSSRKLVIEDIEDPIDKEKIEMLINRRLFSIEIDSKDETSNPQETISQGLKTRYENLFYVINNNQEKPSILLTKYVELLKNEL